MTLRLHPARPTARLALAAAVVALAATACGGAADEASGAPSASAPAEATPSPVPSSTAGDAPSSPATTPEGKSAAYISSADYEADKAAYDAGGDVVLFFHAPWCPTCKRADANLTESGLPAGLTVVKTDYDSSTDLRRRYGVTVQHTFVQVDPSGEQLAKFTGADTADEIAAQTV